MIATLVALGACWARLAAACSETCPGQGWYFLDTHSGSSIPRDGALVFRLFGTEDMCIDDLWRYLDIEVRRGRTAAPGRVELVGGAHQWIEPAPHELPELLQGQVLYELFVDGELVARDHDLEFFGAVRTTPGCAVLAISHLGTGETVRSPEACTPPEVAAALGVHLRDVAAELACDDPVMCGEAYEWDPAACAAYDAANPPPPPSSPWGDSAVNTPCPGLQGPGAGRHTSGCGCDAGAPPGPALTLLLCAALALRRRHRTCPL